MKMDIDHIAKLARLELTQTEKEKYQTQLDSILNYVDKLAEVKTENIPTADGGTRDLENVWREDKNQNINNNNQKELIDMAPEKDKGQVKVKSVF